MTDIFATIEELTGYRQEDLQLDINRGNYQMFSTHGEQNYIIRVLQKNDSPLVHQKFKTEVYVLDLMAEYKEIPTPDLVGSQVSDPSTLIVIMEKLEGVPLQETWNYLSSGDQFRLATQFGQLLNHLHQIRLPGYGLPDEFNDNWSQYLQQRIQQSLEFLDAHLDQKVISLINKRTKTWLPHIRSEEPVLVHADLNAHNLLISTESDNPVITGIVDWEWSFAAHNRYDLVEVESFFHNSQKLLNAFYQGYGGRPQRKNWEYERRTYLLDRFLQTACYYISTGNYNSQQQHLTHFMLSTILKY